MLSNISLKQETLNVLDVLGDANPTCNTLEHSDSPETNFDPSSVHQ